MEIRELTGMKNLSAKTEMKATNIGDALLKVIDQDKELSGDQKRELRKVAAEGSARLENMIRDFTADKNNSDRIFEEAFIQLLDKNFTEEDLRAMAVFYRTETGKKSAQFMMRAFDQISKTFSSLFSKQLQEYMNKKLDEEIELLKQKIADIKKSKSEAE